MRPDEWSRGPLILVGVGHQATPLDVREHLALSADVWRQLAPASVPNVLLSTCSRVDVYGWADEHPLRCARELGRALARAANTPARKLEPFLVTETGSQALLHLVRVASGLDSLVVGEEQIRGQVRAAFREAVASTVLPAPLVGIFERALQAARDIRVETPLRAAPVDCIGERRGRPARSGAGRRS